MTCDMVSRSRWTGLVQNSGNSGQDSYIVGGPAGQDSYIGVGAGLGLGLVGGPSGEAQEQGRCRRESIRVSLLGSEFIELVWSINISEC